jgi:hypothetical protein
MLNVTKKSAAPWIRHGTEITSFPRSFPVKPLSNQDYAASSSAVSFSVTEFPATSVAEAFPFLVSKRR